MYLYCFIYSFLISGESEGVSKMLILEWNLLEELEKDLLKME